MPSLGTVQPFFFPNISTNLDVRLQDLFVTLSGLGAMSAEAIGAEEETDDEALENLNNAFIQCTVDARRFRKRGTLIC